MSLLRGPPPAQRPHQFRTNGPMCLSDLRDLVIDAHGGIARWNKVKTIEGDMSITGGLWARKRWPDVLKNVHVTAAAGNQWISYRPFIARACAVHARLTI